MVTFFLIVLGLLLLVKSADIFVDQASSLAKKLKIGDFLVGFTVVAFGTSLPELMSTIFSASAGHNQLVVANILGSNITNLCLVFGLIAVFYEYRISKRDVNINIPINLAALLAFWVLTVYMNNTLNWAAGVSLILIFFVLMILSKEYNHLDISRRKYDKFRPELLVLSMVVLVWSGKISIDQTIILAEKLSISESILGYFLLAIGTSLPELVTTWTAVKKKDGELGMGNILGSNLFNLLFVLGFSTFIEPVQLTGFLNDIIFLSVVALMTYVFAITGKKYSFSRREGVGLLLMYVSFVVFQIFKV